MHQYSGSVGLSAHSRVIMHWPLRSQTVPSDEHLIPSFHTLVLSDPRGATKLARELLVRFGVLSTCRHRV